MTSIKVLADKYVKVARETLAREGAHYCERETAKTVLELAEKGKLEEFLLWVSWRNGHCHLCVHSEPDMMGFIYRRCRYGLFRPFPCPLREVFDEFKERVRD